MSDDPEFCPKCAVQRLVQAERALDQVKHAMGLARERLLPFMPEAASDVDRFIMAAAPGWATTAQELARLKARIREEAMLDDA